jgi:hypothetical protein
MCSQAESVIALAYPAGNAQLIDVAIDAVSIPDGAKNVMVAVSGFENGSAFRRRLLSSLDRDDALNMTDTIGFKVDPLPAYRKHFSSSKHTGVPKTETLVPTSLYWSRA